MNSRAGWTSSNLHMVLGNYAAVRAARQKRSKEVGTIQAIMQKAKDLYLMAEEPDLDGNFNPLEIAPVAVVPDVISCLKSLQALAAYHRATSNARAVDPDLVAEAETLANAALGDVPGGGSKSVDNALAHYVLGLAKEAKGTLVTAKAPLDAAGHQVAQADFQAAITAFGRAHANCSGSPQAWRTAWERRQKTPRSD